jgi:hypothetical protein
VGFFQAHESGKMSFDSLDQLPGEAAVANFFGLCCIVVRLKTSFTLRFADNCRWLLNDTPQGSYKRCFMPITRRSSRQTVLIIIIMVMVSIFRRSAIGSDAY